jgi:DAACS family dicarboxylate/amino acid:cation (Na+ or H+) symporter
MSTDRAGTPLHTKVLYGLGAGTLLGIGANWLASQGEGARAAVAVAADGVAHPIGQVFLRMLFLVVIPIVFASLTLGVAGLGDLRHVGRIGVRTLAFFLVTTALSVLLALVLANVFRPGEGFDAAARDGLMRAFGGDAAAIGEKAAQSQGGGLLAGVNRWLDYFLPRNVLQAVVGMQMLPLIVASLLFGMALTQVEAKKRQAMIAWLETLGEAMVAIVGFAMKLAPWAVACLIFSVVARFGVELLGKLAYYVVLVLAAYAVQLFIFYPLLLAGLARRWPVDFMRRALPVAITAFSTSSSSATLPTSLRVAQEDLGIRPHVAGFVLPLGATMNMNGTALFEGVLVLFLAQIFGVELTLAQQGLVLLLCVVSAVGAAGVPGGALPLIMIILAQVGVPPDGIAIVLGVDRLLDMGRTVVNVLGDLVCAAWIERTEGPGEPATRAETLRPAPPPG